MLRNRIKSRLITTRRELQEQVAAVIGLDARSAGNGECMSLSRTCHTMLNMCGPCGSSLTSPPDPTWP